MPFSAQQLAELHAAQRAAVVAFQMEPRAFRGRGIVTAVYDSEFASAWVLFSELARLKVKLPIEALHLPGELSERHAALLGSLGLNLTVRPIAVAAQGFAFKPWAIWRSTFQEVLWIDADNVPIRDPAFLFDDPEYRKKGSLFWRDVSGVDRVVLWHPQSDVWRVFNVPPNDSEEFESGQLLIDKERCWQEMGLTLHMNGPEPYRSLVMGDKDVFRLAWQNLAAARGKGPASGYRYLSEAKLVPYGFMPYGLFHMGQPNAWHKWGGGTVMVQRDRDGAALFNHRNMAKFRLEGDNPFNADIANEATYHAHMADLKKRLRSGPR